MQNITLNILIWESERKGCGGSKHFPFVVSLTANVASAFCPSKNNRVECVKKEAFLIADMGDGAL